MQFITLTLSFAAIAAATPAALKRVPAEVTGTLAARHSRVCPGLGGTPQCCQLDVLGVAAVTCAAPSRDVANAADFEAVCAETGETALCCVLPLAGLGLLCQAP